MAKIARVFNYRKPLSEAFISEFEIIEDKTDLTKRIKFSDKPKKVMALFDTGATISVISKKIAKELNLKPIGITKVNSVSHENIECNTYEAAIGIPVDEQQRISFVNGIPQKEIRGNIFMYPIIVTESEALVSQEIDLLLGMDFISEGVLVVTDNMFIFSLSPKTNY